MEESATETDSEGESEGIPEEVLDEITTSRPTVPPEQRIDGQVTTENEQPSGIIDRFGTGSRPTIQN